MVFKQVLFFITFYAYLLCIYCENAVGDTCITNENSQGTCELLTHCPSELKKIKDRIIPKLCRYAGTAAIVCCPISVSVNKTYERTSEEKCKIYSQCDITSSTRFKRDSKTQPTQYPHMAAIGWNTLNGRYSFLCEGSLVSENFVLTAAHCTSLNEPNLKSSAPSIVRLGDRNLETPESFHTQDINIKEIIVHPKYFSPRRYDNIALLKLEKSIIRSAFINPICLWRSRDFHDSEPTATGWGQLDYLEGTSNVLRKVSITAMESGECSQKYKYPAERFRENIKSEQFCGISPNSTTFTCQGDTGSPLQISDPQHGCSSYLIGVTSFGAGCGGQNYPAVYTRISSYIPWIEDTVWF